MNRNRIARRGFLKDVLDILTDNGIGYTLWNFPARSGSSIPGGVT